MPVISNTSPLLNLAIIDHLFLLKKQIQEIHVPEAVLAELRISENLPGSDHLKSAFDAGWLKVRKVKNKAFVQLLRRDLDEGESEAIALAVEEKANLILLDEKEARRIARSLKLQTTGVLGIALKGWYDQDIQSMQKIIESLRSKANFHIAANLEEQILRETGEI